MLTADHNQKMIWTWSTGSIAVPEPATWATMPLGFASLGFTGYRTSGKALSTAVDDQPSLDVPTK
jgi:hypothetical protein